MSELTMEQMTGVMIARQKELREEMDTQRREFEEAMAPRQAEHDRLTRALNALSGETPPSRSRRQSNGSAGRPKGTGKRADEAFAIIKDQPEIAISEIAERMGIKQNYLYRVLPGLVGSGRVVKYGRGYRAV